MTPMKPKSKCWTCSRAVTDKCSWAARYKPVEGWTAEPNPALNSYLVYDCPLYSPDKPMKFSLDRTSLSLLDHLCTNIVICAIRDWKKASTLLAAEGEYTERQRRNARKKLKDCEEFFLSDWFETLSAMNGELLLEKLRADSVPDVNCFCKTE